MKLSPQYLAGVVLLAVVLAFLRQTSIAEEPPGRPFFTHFPLEIDGQGMRHWVGREVGLEAEVLEVLRVDDYMMRVYAPADPGPGGASLTTTPPVWVYTGYYRSQRTGVTYHSPLNCLPGSGWSIISRETVPIAVPSQQRLTVNKVLIEKGLERQLILYWYQDRGHVITNEYWAKGYLVWDAMTRNRTDGALVRVSVPVATSVEDAFALAVQFVQDTYPLLTAYLPA